MKNTNIIFFLVLCGLPLFPGINPFSSSPSKISNAFATIKRNTKDLEQISKTSRATNIKNFMNAINKSDVNDSLRYLVGGKLTIYDTTDGKNLFNVIKNIFAKTPRDMKKKMFWQNKSNEEKRSLLLFVMFQLIAQTKIDTGNILAKAQKELSDMLIAEKAWKETK